MDSIGKGFLVKVRIFTEFVIYEVVEIYAHEVAGVVCVAAELTAGVCNLDIIVVVA